MKKKKRRQNQKIAKILILCIVIIFLIAIIIQIFNYYNFSKIKEIKTIEMEIKVSDHIGINLDTESLIFGTVIPGGGATRSLRIESDEPVFVTVKLKGALAKWSGVKENNFVFNGTKFLTFFVNVPKFTQFGNYTGEAIIIFKKV